MTMETKKLIDEIKKYYKVSDLSELNEDNWTTLSWYFPLTEKFMDKYSVYLDWKTISEFQELSEPVIEKHIDKLNGKNISLFQNISEEFFDRHKDKLDYISFLKNPRTKITNIKPEYVNVILKYDKNLTKDIYRKLKRKFQTQKFWKSYIKYLKNKYPDKNIFQINLLNTIIKISEKFNIDKEKLINTASKIITKKTENKQKELNIN